MPVRCPSRARCNALRIALGQELLYLAIAGGPLGGGVHKPGLVPATRVAVAGMPAAVAVALNLRAAAFGAYMLSRYHRSSTNPILSWTTAKFRLLRFGPCAL